MWLFRGGGAAQILCIPAYLTENLHAEDLAKGEDHTHAVPSDGP